jgi:hypothetical protein
MKPVLAGLDTHLDSRTRPVRSPSKIRGGLSVLCDSRTANSGPPAPHSPESLPPFESSQVCLSPFLRRVDTFQRRYLRRSQQQHQYKLQPEPDICCPSLPSASLPRYLCPGGALLSLPISRPPAIRNRERTQIIEQGVSGRGLIVRPLQSSAEKSVPGSGAAPLN